MGWLSSFLHPERGYKQGQKQLDKYYQQAGQHYNQAQDFARPYNQYGQQAYGDYSNAMHQLLNPEELQNQWAQGYETSPYAKMLQGEASQHGLNAASSMGLMGSTPALQAIQAGTSQIGAADRQQYMNDLMQKMLAGTGIAGNIFNTGASTANQMGQNAMNMGQNAMNMGQNSAGMAYGQQNAPGGMFSGLLGMGTGLLGSALAGPMGGMLGNYMGGKGWSLSGGR